LEKQRKGFRTQRKVEERLEKKKFLRETTRHAIGPMSRLSRVCIWEKKRRRAGRRSERERKSKRGGRVRRCGTLGEAPRRARGKSLKKRGRRGEKWGLMQRVLKRTDRSQQGLSAWSKGIENREKKGPGAIPNLCEKTASRCYGSQKIHKFLKRGGIFLFLKKRRITASVRARGGRLEGHKVDLKELVRREERQDLQRPIGGPNTNEGKQFVRENDAPEIVERVQPFGLAAA